MRSGGVDDNIVSSVESLQFICFCDVADSRKTMFDDYKLSALYLD